MKLRRRPGTPTAVRTAPLAALLAAATGLLAPRALPALSLEEAWALVLQRAPALEAERAVSRRADAALGEARASRGPELSFAAAAGVLASPPEGITVREGELGEIVLPGPVLVFIPDRDLVFIEDARHTYFEFSAKLAQPLYTWGKLRCAEELAAGQAQAQRLRLERLRRELRRELRGLYFGALAAGQSVPALVESVAVLEELAADRRRAAELGEGTRLAVLEMDSRLARARTRLQRARESEATALQALALLVDLPPEAIELTSWFGDELFGAPEASEEAQLGQQARAVSPSLALARQELALAETAASLSRAGAARRPDVNLSLGLSVSGQAVPWSEPDWAETWDWDLVLGVGTKSTLLDAGRSRARIRQAEEGAAAARAALEAASRQLRLAVRQAVQELRVREAELVEREAALREAEEAERAAQVAFQQQAAPRESWGLARLQLAQRRLELLETQAALETAAASLEYLAGPVR